MTRVVFVVAFLLGVAAIVAMGLNFIQADVLALTVTLVIGGVYAIGAVELLRFRRATAALDRALGELSDEAAARLTALDQWLIQLPPSLHHPVRRRIEGDRVSLPAPVLTPYLVSLLIMLGLLGTFVGLVVTLKGVVFALEGSSELEAIRQALTAPMGGLGLAFGTSVAGVAASAMLGLMSTLSRHDRLLCTRRLDQKIIAELRRFSLAHQQQETLKALQTQSQGWPEVAQRLHDLVAHMEKLGTQLTTNQERFHQSAKAHYGELAAAVDRTLRDSVEKIDGVLTESGRLVGEGIRPVVQEAMAEIGTEVGRSAQDTHQQLSRTMQEQLQGLSAAFSQTSEEVSRAWQEGLAAHGQSNEALVGEMKASFGVFSEEFSSASARVLDSVRRTTADWSERQQTDETARLARWTETLQQTQQQGSVRLEETATAIIGELQAVSESQRNSFKSITDDVATISSELNTQLQQSGEQAVARQQQLTTAWDETARSMAENAEAGASRMLTEMGRLLSASEALVQTRTETEQAWLEGQEQRMQQLTATLREELVALRDAEAKRGDAAVERLTELQTTVTDHLATLGQALEQPMTRLIELASETPKAAAEVIGQLRREISDNIERDNHQLEERNRLMAELDAVTESLSRSSAGQLAAVEKLVDSSAGMLQEVGERFSRQVVDEVSRVSEVADHFAAGAVEISSLGEAFSAAVELYNSSNAKLTQSLRRIEEALEKSTTRSDEQLGYYVAQAREVIDYSVLTQKEIFDELRQLRQNGADDQDSTPDPAPDPTKGVN